jgi:hypothetical protein
MSRPILAAILLSLLVAGCIFGGRERAEQQRAAVEAEKRAIERQLGREPGVTKVEASYTRDFSTAGSVGVDMSVEPSAARDPERLLDLEERAVWQSKLAPVTAMFLSVRLATDPSRVTSRTVYVSEDKARLDAAYGPRPAPPDG